MKMLTRHYLVSKGIDVTGSRFEIFSSPRESCSAHSRNVWMFLIHWEMSADKVRRNTLLFNLFFFLFISVEQLLHILITCFPGYIDFPKISVFCYSLANSREYSWKKKKINNPPYFLFFLYCFLLCSLHLSALVCPLGFLCLIVEVRERL